MEFEFEEIEEVSPKHPYCFIGGFHFLFTS